MVWDDVAGREASSHTGETGHASMGIWKLGVAGVLLTHLPCDLGHPRLPPSTPGVKPASPAWTPPLPGSLLGRGGPTSALLRTVFGFSPALVSARGYSMISALPAPGPLQKGITISWGASESRCPLPPTGQALPWGVCSVLTSDLGKGGCPPRCPQSYLYTEKLSSGSWPQAV